MVVVAELTEAYSSDSWESIRIHADGINFSSSRNDYELYHKPVEGNSYGSEGTGTVSVSNGGQTVTIQPSTGNQPLDSGDMVRVYIDCKQLGDKSVKTTVNPGNDPSHTYQ
ncbi:MAG: hypothetical protein ABEJ64_03390 [Candidatus Nanohaloarchaea archaeon]